MRLITDFQIIDHGVEHSQSFRGCGVAFTQYDDCVTGIGFHSAKEAFEDCLEQLVADGYGIPKDLEAAGAELSDSDDVAQTYADVGEEIPEDSELYYCLSIRLKTSEVKGA